MNKQYFRAIVISCVTVFGAILFAPTGLANRTSYTEGNTNPATINQLDKNL